MKILFISSGNKIGTNNGVSSFVRSQMDSLIEQGEQVDLFPVVGHGIRGYLKNLKSLRQQIKQGNYDIVHAHYSTCAWLTELALCCLSLKKRPKLVVSILGSFPCISNKGKLKRRFVNFSVSHLWDKTIVKSRRTLKQLLLNDKVEQSVLLLPNGVNLEQFTIVPQQKARQELAFEKDMKYVIFVSNPNRVEKRWSLAENVVQALNDEQTVLVPVFNRSHNEVVKFMCAADVLLLTSFSEGSPNVIKEAMACNLPIVTTDVGDVHERLDNLEGCFVAEEDSAQKLAECLKQALAFSGRTNGREALIEQGLTTQLVAKKLISTYINL